jgi:hypothetical protein
MLPDPSSNFSGLINKQPKNLNSVYPGPNLRLRRADKAWVLIGTGCTKGMGIISDGGTNEEEKPS